MKAQTTAIVAVVAVLALALASVSGVTYSWFSDSEEAEINVSTGKIDMSTVYSDVEVQSYNGQPIPIGEDASVTTDLEGTVSYATANTSTSSKMTITFIGMSPGDKVSFTVTNTIVNSIKVNYAGSYSIVETTSSQDSVCPITVVMDEGVKSFSKVNENNASWSVEDEITISMAQSVEDVEERSYKISFLFQAIQGNVAPDALKTEQVSAGETSSVSVAGASENDKVKETNIDMPAFDENVTITAQALIEAPTTFVVKESETVIGGVSVDIRNDSGAYISELDAPATVTMKVSGSYTSQNLAIYHESGALMDATFTPGTGDDVGYTIITFNADKFSSYIAVESPCVKVGEEYYFNIEEAVDAAEVGSTLTLLRDIELNKTLVVKKDITIDGAEFTVTFDNELSKPYTNWGISMHAGTLKNITIVGSDEVWDGTTYGFRASGSNGALVGDVSFDNVNLTGTYAINFNTGSEAEHSISFNNSILNGWSSYGTGIIEATFTECTFGFNDREGNSHYGYLRPYINTTFDKCEFVDSYKIDGTIGGTIPGLDFTFTECTFGEKVIVTGAGTNMVDGVVGVFTADQLVAALDVSELVDKTKKVDKVIKLMADICIDPANMSNAYGTTGINVKNGQTIDGNKHTLNINGAGGTWDSGISTTGGVIKNITVTGSFRGIFINHNSTYSEKVVLENVIIDGTTYTISCDQGLYQDFEATNCTFNGWTSYAATLGNAKFTDCKFGEGNGYAYCRPYAPTEFVGCEFEAGFVMDPRAAVTLENCTLDGVTITNENVTTLVTNISNVTVEDTVNA